MTKALNIVMLYDNAMNIYGDRGNCQILQRRSQLYGYTLKIESYNGKDDIKKLQEADLVVGGGGQDSGQKEIIKDLINIKPELMQLAHDKVPMLVICGMYQLFGHNFTTATGDKLEGLGLFDAVTKAGKNRLIGNTIVESTEWGQLIGYENHSGLTTLSSEQASLGKVVKGAGNNGIDGHEGARRYAVIGSYLHGPILAANPALADWLIVRATERKWGDTKLTPKDEQATKQLAELKRLTKKMREINSTRPR